MVPLSAVTNYLALDESRVNDWEEFAIQALCDININPVLEHRADVLEVSNYTAILPDDLLTLRTLKKLNVASDDVRNMLCDCCEKNSDEVDCSCCSAGEAYDATPPVGLFNKQICRITHQGITYVFDYYAFITGRVSTSAEEIKMVRTPYSARICKTCSEGPYCSHTYELYSDFIRFSFEEGTVCLDYYTFARNDEGEILVPDDALLLKSIASYISWRHWELRWNRGEEGAERRMHYYQDRWYANKRDYKGHTVMKESHDKLFEELYRNTRYATQPPVFNLKYKNKK